MAESFVLSIAQGVIQKLGSEALKEIGLAWGVKEELEKLEVTLNYIKAVLMDAELQQSRSPSHELQQWMKSLKHACYSINDVMAEFEYRALQKRLLQPNFAKKMRLFFSSSNPVMFRHRMGHAIKQINERLDKIADNRNKFGLSEREENKQVILRESSSASTHASLGNLKVFGRETERETIINLIRANPEHQGLDVVPIVGMGGLGKTVLAKMVYNDERLTEHFDLKGWVCVSEDFNVSSLLRKILKDLTGTPCDDWSNGQVVSQLQLVLRGRRFLLVLDDVWEEDRGRWVELISLLVGENGSTRVLVTTRIDSIASMVATLPVQKLQGIPCDDSKRLFFSWAFKEGEEDLENLKNLLRIGEEIVSKCKGVPLAIRTLGSLLYLKRDERDWLSVRDNEIWRMEVVDEGGILPALRLSYEHLPSHLKQCFAYLSTYPKDYSIHSNELVNRWIALGFIQATNQTEELERIGIRYIQELFSRSFLEEVVDMGSFLYVSVHDLVMDLALLVAQNEYATIDDIHSKDVDKETRYLTFNSNIEPPSPSPFPQGNPPGWLLTLQNVRSVTGQMHMRKPIYDSFVNLFILKFKNIRVLDLSFSVCVALPSNIGDLKHLRILDLSYNRNLKFLPESVGKLLFLQVLDLYGCIAMRKLPKGLGNLVSLRELNITTQQSCLSARAFQGLVSIHTLGITKCNNLQHLFDDDGDGAMWMQRSLINLRWLYISGCHNLVSLPHGLRYLHALETLTIRSCEKLDLNENNSKSSEGPDDDNNNNNNNVDATGGMTRLKFLSIWELPNLVVLPQWLIQCAANSLEQLQLYDCHNLTSFPGYLKALRRVLIGRCPKVTTLPEGLNSCGMLKELIVEDCPQLTRRCQRYTGEDWGKISSVPDILVDYVRIQSSGDKKWYESKTYVRVAKNR